MFFLEKIKIVHRLVDSFFYRFRINVFERIVSRTFRSFSLLNCQNNYILKLFCSIHDLETRFGDRPIFKNTTKGEKKAIRGAGIN